VVEARIVLGAVSSRPLAASKAAERLSGQSLSDDVIESVSVAATELAKPMDNTDFELVWRKRMVKTLVSAALREVRGDDVSELRQRLAKQTLTVIS